MITADTITDGDIERILRTAMKREDIDLIVACEDALKPIQREETRRAACRRVVELLKVRP